jgi:hypothetical protein
MSLHVSEAEMIHLQNVTRQQIKIVFCERSGCTMVAVHRGCALRRTGALQNFVSVDL